MPRVAVAAAVLFVLWLLVRNSHAYRGSVIGGLFGFLTFLVVSCTIAYYGLKALRWMKRVLLWRVRRRLMITYLFVGLTPIILLALLGFLAAMGGSGQAMSRIVTVRINTTERQTLDGARALADALARQPSNAGDQNVQRWLDERTALLQASLPGARVAIWRGGAVEEAATALGHRGPARFTSASDDEATRGVGGDDAEMGAPLPEWLSGRDEWSGLTFMPPPADSAEAFGSPSMRALVRRTSNGQTVVVLLVVPVSRALVEQFRESTGIHIRPFFLGAEEAQARERGTGVTKGVTVGEPGTERPRPEKPQGIVVENNGRPIELDFSRDQFGEPLPNITPFIDMWYPMFLPATNWLDGERSQRWAFMIDWSWREASRQLWGDNLFGEAWRQALIGVGIAFLVLELLALLSAAWMTRAVTGAVHKLYRATEFIKRGDFSHRVHIRSPDQLGELAEAFNDMSTNIESLLEERVERERLEREVEIAAEVQAQLFPRSVPRLPTAEIAGECRAARGVAGDYYDYIEIVPGLVAFALGDVSGKGISASLVMSNLQAALRAQTTIVAERLKIAEHATAVAGAAGGEGGLQLLSGPEGAAANGTVAGVVANINEQLCRSTETNRFATLFLALYDDRTRELRYTNAGHNAAILLRADGTVRRLAEGGVMVGAFDWSRYEEAHLKLEAGDLLLIFSDGISESQNTLGEEYGEERLTRFAVAHRDWSADEMRHAIFDEIDHWSGAKERDDDQTLVIVKSRRESKV